MKSAAKIIFRCLFGLAGAALIAAPAIITPIYGQYEDGMRN